MPQQPSSPSWSLPKLTSFPPVLPSSLCQRRTFPLCRSTPYDSYEDSPGGRPAAGGSDGAKPGNTKTAQIQQQIDDTVGIMRENITKVAERGERLDALQDKTGAFFHPRFSLGRGWRGDFADLSIDSVSADAQTTSLRVRKGSGGAPTV